VILCQNVPEVWKRLTHEYPRQPASWKFVDGDETEGSYVHSSPVLAMSFSPDDSVLAIAGGGFLPRSDPTIRLIDSTTLKNTRTLMGHVHGIHDISFDRETGILASASHDYSVCLWNLSADDVIFLYNQCHRTTARAPIPPVKNGGKAGLYTPTRYSEKLSNKLVDSRIPVVILVPDQGRTSSKA